MMRLKHSILSCAVGLLAAGSLAEAGLISNGGFETGDETGWSSTGTSSVETSAFGTAPSSGTYQGLVTNADGVGDDTIETFLCLDPGSLNGLSTYQVTVGSAIKQTISGNAGDVLSFDWNFLTNESFQSDFNDFGFWSLVNAQGAQVLADTYSSALGSSLTDFDLETEYMTTTFTLASSGNFTLGFGVLHVVDDDPVGESGLLIDNVMITPDDPSPGVVPEPGSLAIFGIAGLGLCAAGIRRRKRDDV